jgi:TPR repeat protein
MPIDLQQPRTAKRQLSKTEKRAHMVGVGMFLAIGLLAAMLMDSHSPLVRWGEHHDRIVQRDQIASAMIPLAEAGRPDAVIWYALHYPNPPLEPLRKLADAGNAQAQWALAGLIRSSDRPAALRLAKLAADAGYPDAVAYEVHADGSAKSTAASSDAGTVGKS